MHSNAHVDEKCCIDKLDLIHFLVIPLLFLYYSMLLLYIIFIQLGGTFVKSEVQMTYNPSQNRSMRNN